MDKECWICKRKGNNLDGYAIRLIDKFDEQVGIICICEVCDSLMLEAARQAHRESTNVNNGS